MKGRKLDLFVCLFLRLMLRVLFCFFVFYYNYYYWAMPPQSLGPSALRDLLSASI